jgi:hypothetical protein
VWPGDRQLIRRLGGLGAEERFLLVKPFAMKRTQASDHCGKAVVERKTKQSARRDDDDRSDAGRNDL